MSQDGGGVTVSVSWLRDGHEVPVQADQAMERFWSVSSDQVGGFESLQGRGRKLPHTSLGQERALDGLQLWRGLGVLQGGVGGCHRTLRRHAKDHVSLRNLQFSFKVICSSSSVTLTSLGSWCGSWLLGSLSLWTIQGCLRTCLAVSLWWGSTWSILDTRSCGNTQWTSDDVAGAAVKSAPASTTKHDVSPHLGGVRHSVPVAPAQAEVAIADPVQDLIRGVLGSVGKWRKAGEESGHKMRT